MIYPTSGDCQKQLAGIEAIDYFCAAKLCQRFQRDSDALLFHLFLALQWSQRQGHSCLPLTEVAGQLLWQDPATSQPGYRFAEMDSVNKTLAGLPLSADAHQPVVLEHDCLYLRRYWQFEQEVAQALSRRLGFEPVSEIQRTQLQPFWSKLFASSSKPEQGPDWQQVAVANAIGRRFNIISGGPGTGKTYTVARVLAAMQAASETPLKILMAAPTGKAAQRLKESIEGARQQLAEQGISDAILEAIPQQAATLHRLLGFRPNSLNLKHDGERPLDCDLLLIDEVSMVDLPMFARVLRALPQRASLVLLGDVDQLPSVDTGCVLADLACRQHPGFSPEVAEQIRHISGQQVPVDPSGAFNQLTLLTRSYRFGGDIGRIAKQVIAGEADASWSLLQDNLQPTVSFEHAPDTQLTYLQDESLDNWLAKACDHYFGRIGRAGDLSQAFSALAAFRILVATRVGERGVVRLNQEIEQRLASKYAEIRPGQHYPGRPIMVTENNYASGLFNGDVGLVWPDGQGKLHAWFEIEDGGYRQVHLSRLPAVETVYAMTIHKTQGSEFGHVALILPEQTSEILSPELIYTGLTRAKQHLYVLGQESVWRAALKQRIRRYSGLKEKLSA